MRRVPLRRKFPARGESGSARAGRSGQVPAEHPRNGEDREEHAVTTTMARLSVAQPGVPPPRRSLGRSAPGAGHMRRRRTRAPTSPGTPRAGGRSRSPPRRCWPARARYSCRGSGAAAAPRAGPGQPRPAPSSWGWSACSSRSSPLRGCSAGTQPLLPARAEPDSPLAAGAAGEPR